MGLKTNEEIWNYLDRVYLVPAHQRSITFTDVEQYSGVDARYIYNIRKNRIRLSRRLRYQLGSAMDRLGEPKRVAKRERTVDKYKSNRNTWFKRFERKLDAILRAYKLNPADYER